MKTINFTINSIHDEYRFPNHEDIFGRITLLKTDENEEGYTHHYKLDFNPNRTTEDKAFKNYFTEVLIPDFLKEVSTPTGDDSYYDYRPDHVQMLVDFNRDHHIHPTGIFQDFLTGLNNALHLLNTASGWALDDED